MTPCAGTCLGQRGRRWPKLVPAQVKLVMVTMVTGHRQKYIRSVYYFEGRIDLSIPISQKSSNIDKLFVEERLGIVESYQTFRASQ